MKKYRFRPRCKIFTIVYEVEEKIIPAIKLPMDEELLIKCKKFAGTQ